MLKDRTKDKVNCLMPTRIQNTVLRFLFFTLFSDRPTRRSPRYLEDIPVQQKIKFYVKIYNPNSTCIHVIFAFVALTLT